MASIYSNIELPSTKVVISAAASAAGAAMFIRSIARDFVPGELRDYVSAKFRKLLSTFSNEATILIEEYDGLKKNRLFYAAELHLGKIVSPSTTRTYRATLPEKEKEIYISLGGNDEIVEKFCGMEVRWRLVKEQIQPRHVPSPDGYRSAMVSESRYLHLSFHKKHYQKVVDEYLPYVLESSEAVKEGKKTLKLYTLKNDGFHGPGISPWQFVNLDHPSKFETLAMDDEVKSMVIEDLELFLKRKDFYRKVGKAWKRGYLLFGPPGTGKSSLIAAMANYLNFDVYDLELSDIRSDSELRRLLISTANRSILVVEDIDASIDLPDRKSKRYANPLPPSMHPFHEQRPKVTLSGLLNFVDGLWSSIGDERVIIFTTNHKDRLDPALLRPGRMDVHINMSYCTPCGFRLLASNYLGITGGHPLLVKAEELIASGKVTPAEVGEQLLKRQDPELALRGLISFLQLSREEEKVTVEEEVAGDGIGELVKMAQESGKEMKVGGVIQRHEAVDALKILVGFLQQEIGTENKEGS